MPVFPAKSGTNSEESTAKGHFCVEWRTKDQSNVKVYEQKRVVNYADYKVGLFYISPFELFVEEEAVITRLEKKKSTSMRE